MSRPRPRPRTRLHQPSSAPTGSWRPARAAARAGSTHRAIALGALATALVLAMVGAAPPRAAAQEGPSGQSGSSSQGQAQGQPQAQTQGQNQNEIRVPYARSGVAGVPNYYVVRPGDTLFRICEAYFGNPFVWPRIWSYNPQITNPHWIYPGDVIFLRPAASPSSAPAPRPPGRPGTHYALGGFYTGTELENVGFIRFSPTPYASLSLMDDVYVQFKDHDAVQVGDRFALNRVLDRIYNDDDELIGVKYLVTGMIEVTAIPNDSPLIVARIVQAWDVIERGDVLFVNQRHMRVVEPRAASVDLEARIIDFLEPYQYAMQTSYVFIDAGYNQGVREGNRFTVWAKSDEYVEYRDGTPGFDEDDHAEDLPWRALGEAIVIFTTNDYSTAVLTNSRLELTRNMRVTLTNGY